MTQEIKTLLEAFEALPVDEKRIFADEILRRLPLDSGPLADDEIDGASSQLFELLDQEDGPTRSR